jgi:hypothetical protein
MKENRGPWYLLTGFVLGLILGVGYSWIVRPIQYINTSPASLRADFKDQYRALIAAAYAANGDLVRARGRLSLLQDEDIYRILAAQAQQTLADGNSSDEARALGMLAVAIGQGPSQPAGAGQPTSPAADPEEIPSLSVSPTLTGTLFSTGSAIPAPAELLTTTTTPTPTLEITTTNPISGTLTQNDPFFLQDTGTIPPTDLILPTRTATPTRAPTATGTLLPTRTATATPGAPYILEDQQKICEPDLNGPLVQVVALDAAGSQVPGVEAIATWPGGEQLFYTGLKPELGSGYADVEITVGITYTVRLAGAGQSVPGLAAFECEDSGGERYWGSWLLTFIQP